ncbi:MAG TPA: DJ-1/PfpI family protein [Gemmatimonadales bacterium]|nr:DJ-1/PfpI family protein [Gemmatimonadales bacterium]
MHRRTFVGATAAGIASVVAGQRLFGATAAEPIPVAFLVGDSVNVIDTAGPWEVHGFSIFTVGPSTKPLRATGGLQLVPDYDYRTAPAAKVVVVPAHRSSDATLEFLGARARTADLIMSVCTGAFVLGRAGLLDGKTATTHHEFWDDFERSFPNVKLERGPRFVEHDRVATAGGLTSGIDLALRVVERYHGREAATATATYMEYESRFIGAAARRRASNP